MRILVVGDQHFRHELSYGPVISDGRRAEWDAVIAAIHKAAESCDAVVLLGDNFNSRHNHSSVIRRFVDFLNGFGDKMVHIIAGNHERYGKETAIDFLRGTNKGNWHIYTEPTLANVAGWTSWMIPYTTPAMMNVETKEQAHDKIMEVIDINAKFQKPSFIFMHHGIRGSIWEVGSVDVDMFNEITFTQKELEDRFDFAFGGHVHFPQKLSPKVVIAGSILTTEVGEDAKYVWVVNYPEKTIEQIELPVRGIYKHIWNGPSSLMHIPDNSIVKCIVNDRAYKIDEVKEHLKRFDGSVLLEQYPNERTKVHFEEGMLDLSLDNLLKVYGQEKGVDYSELSQAYSIVDSYDFNRPRSVASENGNSHP